jgi:hypothetical protein
LKHGFNLSINPANLWFGRETALLQESGFDCTITGRIEPFENTRRHGMTSTPRILGWQRLSRLAGATALAAPRRWPRRHPSR